MAVLGMFLVLCYKKTVLQILYYLISGIIRLIMNSNILSVKVIFLILLLACISFQANCQNSNKIPLSFYTSKISIIQ